MCLSLCVSAHVTACKSPGVFFWCSVRLYIYGCELDVLSLVSFRVCLSMRCVAVCVAVCCSVLQRWIYSLWCRSGSVCPSLCVSVYVAVCMSSGVVSWYSVTLHIYVNVRWISSSLRHVGSMCLSLCVSAHVTACKSPGVFLWYSVGLYIYGRELNVLSLVSSKVCLSISLCLRL